jgi:hypothetical protein
MFTQIGLPRKIAEEQGLLYAEMLNPESPMWMGFVSQQVGSSGAPAITTFRGNGSAAFTTARSGDYFDRGSVVHLSHVIQDLEQFYEAPSETYVRREAEMFSADPVPRPGNANQFANGGGPAFIANVFSNPQQAAREAAGTTTFDRQPHIAHTTALQRTSRASNRKPIHIRADGPGFDSLDVPDGSQQPKLHFSIFVPTADFFATMRRSQLPRAASAQPRVSARRAELRSGAGDARRAAIRVAAVDSHHVAAVNCLGLGGQPGGGRAPRRRGRIGGPDHLTLDRILPIKAREEIRACKPIKVPSAAHCRCCGV